MIVIYSETVESLLRRGVAWGLAANIRCIYVKLKDDYEIKNVPDQDNLVILIIFYSMFGIL